MFGKYFKKLVCYEIIHDLEQDEEQPKSTQGDEVPAEKPIVILLTIMFPFLIAGFGMVAAGLLFDHVNDWKLYKEVEEIIMLVPALLGLKGNLEMTLASRLSTQVNIGKIHDRRTTITAVLGNAVIIQLQSICVGFLAAFVATVVEYIDSRHFQFEDMLITVAASIATASLASLILASLVMFIIIISHKFNVNPDNIATPISSALGDVAALGLLSVVGTFLYEHKEHYWVSILIICFYTCLIPFFAWYCYHNEFVKETLIEGWVPIIVAMLISSAAGAILRESNKIYPIVNIYQPVINGVGGNLVAIFASRLSTSIQRSSSAGEYPIWAPKNFISYPYQTFFGTENPEALSSQILCLLILPGHIVFFFTLYFIKQDEFELSFLMVLFYMIVGFIQVIILFLICYWIVLFVWKLAKNPDNVCIPYLTAIGDLLGVIFLLLAMHLAYLCGNDSFRVFPTLMPVANSTIFDTTAAYTY